jgi:hypothetical protein
MKMCETDTKILGHGAPRINLPLLRKNLRKKRDALSRYTGKNLDVLLKLSHKKKNKKHFKWIKSVLNTNKERKKRKRI